MPYGGAAQRCALNLLDKPSPLATLHAPHTARARTHTRRCLMDPSQLGGGGGGGSVGAAYDWFPLRVCVAPDGRPYRLLDTSDAPLSAALVSPLPRGMPASFLTA